MKTAGKNDMIKILRDSRSFNCFPIPEKQKIADDRYKASRTVHNQVITENENYGYIPIIGTGTAITDFDNKERFRPIAELMISKDYMVIETPHGWHIPVTGLTGNISKIELFDYAIQDKKIMEIQGTDHYCVGAGSVIMGEKKDGEEGLLLEYKSVGTNKIWNVDGMDFHQFVDKICTECNVEARRKNSNSSYKNYRDRFLKELPPTKGTSNDYFFQAGIQCNTDGLTESEALEKIRIVYDKWSSTNAFSDRPWSNIETKVREVYEKNRKVESGRPRSSSSGIDRTEIAQEMISNRLLYSNVETHNIFENTDGFLEKINDSLKRELVSKYPKMEQSDYNSILFKLEALAQPMPKTNRKLMVFKNGVRDTKTKELIETNDIAGMGFRDYNYLEPTKENEPTKFIEIMFSNVPETEHPRIKAGLKSAIGLYLDPRISVIHGLSGVGKSTGLLVLVIVLGKYAMTVELEDYLNDHFIRAKIEGLTLLVFQEMPKDWKNFAKIKADTGEQLKTGRGFQQDSTMFDNTLKIWGSANYLTKIPENEKNAMYSRRLSLIHNIRDLPYPDNPNLVYEIVENEAEKIVSWILNLPDEECVYEDSKTVRKEWEELASPEIGYLQDNWELTEENTSTHVMKIIQHYNEKIGNTIDIDQMTKLLHNHGFIVKQNMVSNIREKTNDDGQMKL
ncbi:MAG: hypothetical protein K8Q89_05100 [Nitrosarchaeum sp.]|nr:hypothetical protein [Nitrosarchaeum sp.]